MSRRKRTPTRPAEAEKPQPAGPVSAASADATAAPGSAGSPASDGVPLRRRWIWLGALAAIFAVVSTWGQFDFGQMMGYYDLFLDGVDAGHLYLTMTPDQVNLVDMVPYQGKWHFNWGPFPALFHWLPRLAGLRLSDRVAALLAGLASCGVFLAILSELRRRFFPQMPERFVGWFLFAFALGTPLALTVFRGTIYNENIGVGVACVLAGFWAWLKDSERPSLGWAALCGLAVGLALLTRITLCLYGVVFFAGIAATDLAGRSRPEWSRLLGRLTVYSLPILLCGFLQMGFNDARFDAPFDFGNRYKPEHTPGYPLMSAARIPESLGHYFLAPIHFPGDFPYMEHTGLGEAVRVRRAEAASSLLLASPWLVLIVCAWPALRPGGAAQPALRTVARVVAGAGLLTTLAMVMFGAVSRRYAQDFMPAWMLLAFVGAGLCAGVTKSWGRWAPAAWAVLAASFLLHVQIAFYQSFTTPTPDLNVVRAFVAMAPTLEKVAPGPKLREEAAIAANDLGTVLLQQRRFAEAVGAFEQAAAWQPDSDRIRQNLEMARRLAGGR
ncbi:MAG: hypothetical protein GC160_18950 [Acidobacteria bacterium]|nr:hypothetical protein [Acidobacteriota bacterium]